MQLFRGHQLFERTPDRQFSHKMLPKTALVYFLVSYFKVEGLDECVLEGTGEKAVCIRLKECKSAMEKLEELIFPQVCGFEQSEPVVCCPNDDLQGKTRDISAEVCERISRGQQINPARRKRFGLCPRGRSCILGGSHVYRVGGASKRIDNFNYMALIGFDDGGNKSWQCAGSLISERYVLTAAHCVFSKELNSFVKYVRLGDLDYAIETDNTTYQDFTVATAIKHPDYKYPSKYHDIALLKLDRPAILDDDVRPVCLHTQKEIPNSKFLVAGWGKTENFANEGSSHLLKADVELIPHENCSEAYPPTPNELENGLIEEYQICAGSTTGETDTCEGDSGGPLQLRNSRILVGITSIGKGCGYGIPGVYTRISNYIKWIEETAWKDLATI